MVLMVFSVMPLLLVGLSGWVYRNEREDAGSRRRILFVGGLIANAVSGAVMLSFTVQAYRAWHGAVSVDLDGMYPVFSMFCLGLLASCLACFGRRAFKLILFCDGVLTVGLW